MSHGVMQPPAASGIRGLSFWGRCLPTGLGRALLLSLLLHGALLAPSSWPPVPAESARGEGRLQASLRPPVPLTTVVTAKPDRPVRLAAASGGVVAGAFGRKNPLPPARQGRPSDANVSVTDESATDMAEESLSRYRLALAGAARGRLAYPESARRQGLFGVVEIEVIAGPAEPVPRVVLARSSGHAQLDQAALALVERAVHVVPLPAEMLRQPSRAGIPVHFSPGD